MAFLLIYDVHGWLTDWRTWGKATAWSPMVISTKTGSDLSVAGSISQRGNNVDVTDVRRRPQQLCRDLSLDRCGQLFTVLLSSIILASVLGEDLLSRNWRFVCHLFENPFDELMQIWKCPVQLSAYIIAPKIWEFHKANLYIQLADFCEIQDNSIVYLLALLQYPN